MWFGFGLITLLVAFILSIRSRTQARWSGEQRDLRIKTEHWQYQCQEVRNRGHLVKARIGIDAPPGFHFTARSERVSDVFFKRIGISSEIQLRDEEFDKHVYLVSDARGIGILLSENQELRDALLKILRHARDHDLRGMSIRCAYRRLWLEFRPKEELKLASAVWTLVPLLACLREGMRTSRLTAGQLKDPFVWRAALLLSISTASAVLGVYGLVRTMAGRTDIIDAWALFYSSAFVGLVTTAIFVVVILKVLGRSSRAHLVLIEGVLIGSIGFVLSAYALAREANISLDFQRTQVEVLHNVLVQDLRVSRNRGGNKHQYYLHTDDWRPGHAGKRLKLEIPRDEFMALNRQTKAVAFVRSGALGYEWIERFAPVQPLE